MEVNRNKKKIFLTGGNGMVGRHILAHPSLSKWDFFAPNREELDLNDFDSLLTYVINLKPDFIIHCAGHIGGISANVNNPVDFFLKNLDIGRNVILASHKAGIKNLINIGSSCMYPKNSTNPLKEEAILKGQLEPTNEGYALAKIISQRFCKYIHEEDSSFQYKTMIPCNLYGGYDKFDSYRAHLIPAIISKMHRIKESGGDCEIWGDGSARREFMYAGDLADAIFYALDNFNAMPNTINIGVGTDHSISEYYSFVAEVIGFKGNFKYNLKKPVGMKQKLVSIEKQTSWGWSPKVALKDGIKKTYDSFLKSVYNRHD